MTLVSTGSEVYLCLDALEQLKSKGIKARLVSLPCFEVFVRALHFKWKVSWELILFFYRTTSPRTTSSASFLPVLPSSQLRLTPLSAGELTLTTTSVSRPGVPLVLTTRSTRRYVQLFLKLGILVDSLPF